MKKMGSQMSNLDKLINELCPDGVEKVPLWHVTIWDKRFNSVEKSKQPLVKIIRICSRQICLRWKKRAEMFFCCPQENKPVGQRKNWQARI